MDEVKAAGGKVPEESVREVIENLVHAGYKGVVISVLEGGDVVRVSDKGLGRTAQGPGHGVRLLRGVAGGAGHDPWRRGWAGHSPARRPRRWGGR